ncbi:TPA: 2-amino-4-hydroxy-6-hydroxymethyldihydropteridine diphosphokinase [Streptococcus equi subsp. zooepidemicus]|uniref:2-amino-4-hydroxy-6- hydroxymethyldihydropteridine diphosphokinase n=1 Tax=Streptococcus equi TaxID=1336 RepID=UPI00294B8EA2|nr:2-amino-4-hydroxy-6-hydroxymethyldihydropteridine diphosphokinase [Streptococcus equi]WOK56361.1 2-amino-4-hydroxy-6-hydroxymethyldihydropteridine diphosphokinase [Streptococcus equi subsp. zooepidemicus]HEL1074522.1 2-amino-4-hydroxy-6-hydroxymethyldihydropteridine diphosphokinase [Streptococcus equi subsp. zooepidemicus]
MTLVYLGLGTNMGDRAGYLQAAVTALSKLPETELLRQSSIYQTAAWGKKDQNDFLNMVCQLDTKLTPEALLAATQAIEQDLGRVRHEKWGPRTIDIDLLLFGDEPYQSKALTIPHPYMTQRAFVLIPLLEIAPDVTLPDSQKSLRSYLDGLEQSDVALWSHEYSNKFS